MPDEILATPDPAVSSPAPASAAPPADVPYEQWSAAIPQEYREDKHWEAVKGKPLSLVLKNYPEAQRYISGAVRIPGKDAKPEEVDAFYTKLGRPANPAAYETSVKVPQMPEGLEFQQPALAEAYGVFHKAGLTANQAQMMLEHYATVALRTRDLATQHEGQSATEAAQNFKSEIEKVWGPEGSPTYKHGVNSARAFIRQMAVESGLPTDQVARLETLGTDPAFVRVFATAGQKYAGEHGLVLGDMGPMPTSEQAKAEIDALWKELPKKTGREYEAALRRRDELYKLAYGTHEIDPRR